MRISIDARELSGRPTGVGRYLDGLLSAWADLPSARAHTFCFYSHAPLARAAFHGLGDACVIPGSGGAWWEQVQLRRALSTDAPDVHFAPAYTGPVLTAVPLVATIHDLSFLAHPEWFGAREGLRRRWLTRQTARIARVVLTVSECSRREIVERLGVPEARVRCVYHGVTPHTQGPPSADGPDARPPLVLFVGSIFTRRRVPELIQAFGTLLQRHDEARLVIVGDNRTNPREDLRALVRTSGLERAVDIRPYVDQATLDQLFGQARAFAFLSDYEGFGLTPLEALTAGVPILVQDTPIAREIYGKAAFFVSAEDRQEIGLAIERLLYDEETRRAILAEAPSVLSRYSWDRAGRETLAAIEGAVR